MSQQTTRSAGSASSSLTPVAILAALLLPMMLVFLGLAATSSDQAKADASCGPGGSGATIAGTTLDAEQIGNAATIVSVAAGRHQPVFAAIVLLTTAYTEARLRNQLTQTDHDSEGLFQQRISLYGRPVADDPVKATNAFLERLIRVPHWTTNTVGTDAQAVQHSAFPDRYQPNATLGAALAAQFWPAAAAAAATTLSSGPALPDGPPICAGAGGAGPFVGPAGNNVAGTTTIPAGLVINGSSQGRQAVTYALAQLGKPYLWGAAGPAAFDCSGLTMAAWAFAGVPLPHHAASQTGYGTAEPTNLSQAVAGDLVFIPGADGTPANPGHVAMVAGYVDRTDGRHLYLIQAPMTGLPVEVTQATRWAGQIVAARHIA